MRSPMPPFSDPGISGAVGRIAVTGPGHTRRSRVHVASATPRVQDRALPRFESDYEGPGAP